MVFIIARIAGKPAICKWPIKMATDPAWIDCTLDADPRLLIAIGEIMNHAAQRANFSEKQQQELSAAVATCRAVLSSASEPSETNPPIKLLATDFPDRVEVTIDPAGEQVRKALVGVVVDGLKSDVRGDALRITFAKKAPGSNSSNS
jgi:hypothetical protein